jgi:hypothetical protein
MHPKKFESEEALVAYAGENGLTCLLGSFGKWQQQLSPEQYDVVEVQTSSGLRPAMLLPKAVLKAAWRADPLRKALVLGRDPAPFQRKRHHVG